jgi:hypothetical protein
MEGWTSIHGPVFSISVGVGVLILCRAYLMHSLDVLYIYISGLRCLEGLIPEVVNIERMGDE